MIPKLYTAVLALIISSSVLAQIPNSSFENWTAGAPNNWYTSNIPNFTPNVTQSSDAYAGTKAARGECIADPTGGSNDPFPPYFQLLDITTGGGAPVSQNYAECSGWYKLNTTLSSTYLTILVIMSDVNDQLTGIGTAEIYSNTNSYMQFQIPIDYSFGSGQPSTEVTIIFALTDDNTDPGIGSWFLVDDLSLSGVAQGVEDLSLSSDQFRLGTPYPQPFSSSTTLELKVVGGHNVVAEVIDLLGQQTMELLNSVMSPGTYSLTWAPDNATPNGMYFIRVTSDDAVETRRVLLQR